MPLTRTEAERLKAIGEGFVRLEKTDDYLNSLGNWLAEQNEAPLIINADEVKDPTLLQQQYWMLMGGRNMIYALFEQIARWRAEAKIDLGIDGEAQLQN